MQLPLENITEKLSTLCLIILLGAGVLQAGESSGVQGWRRDGRGLYPEANPPTTWSREAIDSVVKTMRCQANKPGGDSAEGAAAIPKAVEFSKILQTVKTIDWPWAEQ